MQIVDQSWTHTRAADPVGGWWALPVVIIAIVVVMLLVGKKPWVLLALFLSLVVVVPVCSWLLR